MRPAREAAGTASGKGERQLVAKMPGRRKEGENRHQLQRPEPRQRIPVHDRDAGGKAAKVLQRGDGWVRRAIAGRLRVRDRPQGLANASAHEGLRDRRSSFERPPNLTRSGIFEQQVMFFRFLRDQKAGLRVPPPCRRLRAGHRRRGGLRILSGSRRCQGARPSCSSANAELTYSIGVVSVRFQ